MNAPAGAGSEEEIGDGLQADSTGSGRGDKPGCPWSDTETDFPVAGNDFPHAVTPPTPPHSPTMVRLHTRAARGGRGRLQGRRSSRPAHPGGKPRLGWRSRLASARPLFFPGTGRRVSRIPVRRAGRAPRAFARSRSGRASLIGKVPPRPSRRRFASPGTRRSPGTPPQDRGRDGEGTGDAPLARQRRKRAAAAGRFPGRRGEPRRDGGTDPATAARYLRPLPQRAGRCRGDGSTPSPGTGLRGGHRHGTVLTRLPWGTPFRSVPPPPAAAARPPPLSDVSPDGLSCPGGARPPPSVTARAPAPGPCAQSRGDRSVRCPPPSPRPLCRQSCTRLS
ncbi:basic proline-rich protein-like [Cinclus cinclus]|uniref:basic proline-rich protein-like n=1 Tax=Cinclus cinclus TaxID=127875 RepID=UPI002E1234E6